MDLRDWVGNNWEHLLPSNPALKIAGTTCTAHVPVAVVFHGAHSTADLAKAEQWVERKVQEIAPQSRIRDRLSKRAARRQRGRLRKNYLN